VRGSTDELKIFNFEKTQRASVAPVTILEVFSDLKMRREFIRVS
jgi:hypothetical protein